MDASCWQHFIAKKAAKDYAHAVSENAEIIQEYEDPYGVNIPNKTFTSIPALGIGDLEVIYKDAISAVGVNPDLLMTAKNRLQGKYEEEPEFLKDSKYDDLKLLYKLYKEEYVATQSFI